MWFNRKPKNRRLEREHVLDVKLRSSQLRAARSRRLALGLGAAFAVVFGLYLVWRTGGWVLDQLVYENKSFSIQEIDLQTDGVIALEQLRRWMGVRVGQNLLALDLARIKRNLELVPVIKSASIERILPRTLRVRVIEREPIAQINVVRPHPGGGVEMTVVHLDAEGYVLLPLQPRQRAQPAPANSEQLPAITGVNASEIQPGRRLEGGQLQAALHLVTAFEQSPMAGLAELRRIDVSAPEVIVITTGQGSEVTFGTSELEQQLRRWHAIFDLGQKMSKAILSLDLAVTNGIPARWLEASAVPPLPPKSPRSLGSKKRHV